jgi:transcriptional regulator with XRE-family HTH domain
MPNVCSICNCRDRLQIDREVVEGHSYEAIARRFGVSSGSISNHARVHLSRQLVAAYEKKELTEGLDLLSRIDKILSRAEAIFERNFKKHHDVTALKALGEQRQTIDMLARIAQYLHEARAAELQSKQSDDEARHEGELQEFASLICDRLTPAELDLFEKLSAKIRGETDQPLAPIQADYPTPAPQIALPKRPGHSKKPAPLAGPTPAAPKRTLFAKQGLSVQPVQPTPIPDASDLPRDRQNPFADAVTWCVTHPVG